MSKQSARARIFWRYGDKTGVYEDSVDCPTIHFWEDNDGTFKPSFFWWEEGNGSCDCNRSAFFGLAPSIEESFPCGETIEVYKMELIDE